MMTGLVEVGNAPPDAKLLLDLLEAADMEEKT